MVKRVFSRRNLLVFAVFYCILWMLTATIGVRQFRSMLLRDWAVPSHCVEVAQEYDGTRSGCGYFFRANSYAPFLIVASWDLSNGDFSTGASGVVLWFGKPFVLPPSSYWIT